MSIWTTLGIEETRDKSALKDAYRRKLVTVNPEDDSEGFMALRSAYEEALRLADLPENGDLEDFEQEGQADTPLTAELKRLYGDFSSRIDLETWKALFNRDEFVSLETEDSAFTELMRFLMEHVFLPRPVWKLIIDQFDIVERRRELAEHFPDNFLSYMINNASFDDIIDYYQFQGDTSDVNDYIQTYYDIDRSLRQNKLEEAEEQINTLENYRASNPYFELARLKLRIRKLAVRYEEEALQKEGESAPEKSMYQMFPEEMEALLADADELLSRMPKDLNLLHMCGDFCIAMKRNEQAKEYYDMAAELYPDNYFTRVKRAEYAFATKDYKEARDIYLDLLKENHYDNGVRVGMIRANQKLVEQHKKILEEEPDNLDSKMEIAWCYYQSYQFDAGIEMLDSFSPTEEKKHEYVNVKGRLYLCLAEYEKALENFELWKRYIEELPPEDFSEECLKKKKRYEYVNFLIADCYLKLEEYDKADKYLSVALAKEHEEIILSYEAKCELEYKRGNFEACIKACDELQDRDGRNYVSYDYRARAFYEINHFNEAFDSSQHAISLYPYVADPYVLQIKIFIKVGQLENAWAVVHRYAALGIDSDKMKYWEARILEQEQKYDRAISCVKDCIARADKEETDLEDFDVLYLFLGHLYEVKDQHQNAIKTYEELLVEEPQHPSVHGYIAENYKKMREYTKALAHYDIQIAREPNAYCYLQRGIINRFMENYKTALADFNHVLEFDPQNFYAHSRIGLILEHHRNFAEALSHYDKALELIERDNERPYRETLLFKARCLQCVKRFSDSYEIYRQYVEEFGPEPDAVYDFSELLMRMGKYQEAITLLRRVIDEVEYGKDVQMCIRQLIDVYAHAGYVDLAHETFEFAMSKDCNDHRACAIIGNLFKVLGQYDKAKLFYMRAQECDKHQMENYSSDILECISHKWFSGKVEMSQCEEEAKRLSKRLLSPRQCIRYARYCRVAKKYKEANKCLDMAVTQRRCMNCFYSKCHEAYAEKALLCVAMRDYEMARHFFEEAIAICGKNSYYEEYLKRIRKK